MGGFEAGGRGKRLRIGGIVVLGEHVGHRGGELVDAQSA
jgi:hypothetical protein